MPAIYVAQHLGLSQEVVEGKEDIGLFLVKIGSARDLGIRATSLSTKTLSRDWRYGAYGGWKIVRFKTETHARLDDAEKGAHRDLKRFRLSDARRRRLFDQKKTGFEMFLGGEDLAEELVSRFPSEAWGSAYAAKFQHLCAPSLHRTSPWEPVNPAPRCRAPGEDALNRIRADLARRGRMADTSTGQ